MNSFSLRPTSFVTLLVLLLRPDFMASFACIVPTPLESGGLSTNVVLSKLETFDIPYLFLPLADPYIAGLVSNYETPIQFRLANLHGTNIYNVVAMYDDTALDIYGREDYRLCSFDDPNDKRAHETVAAAYAFAYSGMTGVPEASDDIRNVLENVLGLPMSLLENSSSSDTSTPWGLAKTVIEEGYNFAESDGWNADGSLRNTFNKSPYSDFDYVDSDGTEYSRYKSTPNSGNRKYYGKPKCTKDKKWNWKPLEESDSKGYFTRQEHVTPHCGFTGRLYGISSPQYESFSSPLPDYNYCDESDFVLDKTAVLATSDEKKMEVELFDSKFTSLLPLQIQWSISLGFSELEFWYYDMALVIAMYDATMLVWRDKILFDLVRPTTVVHELRKNDLIETYGGLFQGLQMVEGKDWQPYKRTMPHAEYPSASACICTAYAEALQTLSPTGDDLGLTLQQLVPAGSSILEPGTTPAQDLVFEFSTWSEIDIACGASRENGGMHFSQAVPAGNALCTGLAQIITGKASLLLAGDPNGAMVDLDDRYVRVKSKVYSTESIDIEPEEEPEEVADVEPEEVADIVIEEAADITTEEEAEESGDRARIRIHVEADDIAEDDDDGDSDDESDESESGDSDDDDSDDESDDSDDESDDSDDESEEDE